MLAENKTKAHDRFLSVLFYIHNSRIKSVLKRLKCKTGYDENVEAYNIYQSWQPQNNEIMVYTSYAYADLSLPKYFNCIFLRSDPNQHVIADFTLTQSILDLGGEWPIRSLSHGHKHFCVLTFEGEIPKIFSRLKEISDEKLEAEEKFGLCSFKDLESITLEWKIKQ